MSSEWWIRNWSFIILRCTASFVSSPANSGGVTLLNRLPNWYMQYACWFCVAVEIYFLFICYILHFSQDIFYKNDFLKPLFPLLSFILLPPDIFFNFFTLTKFKSRTHTDTLTPPLSPFYFYIWVSFSIWNHSSICFQGMKKTCAKFGPDPWKHGGAYKELRHIQTLTYILYRDV